MDTNEFTEKFGVVKEGNLEVFNEIKDRVFSEAITWGKNNDADTTLFPFIATVNAQTWKLRINDFPEEPMYTLFIADKAILTFDDCPTTWKL